VYVARVRDVGALARGREAVGRRAWTDAHEALSEADAIAPLGAADLELLATAAYMLGHDDEFLDELERAHHAHVEAGDGLRAARCAFWSGMNLFTRGEQGRGTGWLARAQRLVEAQGADCVERGYLLMPDVFRHDAQGEPEAAAAIAADAAAVAERFGDRDLFGLAVHAQGHLLVSANQITEGLALLDEAMLAVTSGELSPIVTGIVYCGVILGCQHAYDVRRAQEWTAALTRWCDSQPDMVAFTGRCMTHRAELMLLRGEWSAALDEARQAGGRAAQAANRAAVGDAAYLVGEVLRLRGELGPAEEAYRDAHRAGREPQPGLALLRLAQGDTEAAEASIRRALGETTDVADRTRLLPAFAEIVLAVGDVAAARGACDELEWLATSHRSDMLGAIVAQTRGAVDLVDGGPGAALPGLRRAWRLWQGIDAPYEAARVRVLISGACEALGDRDAAEIELEEARASFVRLGAPDEPGDPTPAHGLTARELQVLRLVATGETNKAIAAELVLSERTVDRHLSNIFAKLSVSSRTAATAYAYEHRLV
jgi:DNA-binding CsgD family transcriptional regulator